MLLSPWWMLGGDIEKEVFLPTKDAVLNQVGGNQETMNKSALHGKAKGDNILRL